ncbi:Nif11-like leader peptide family natural product precursor [Oscillatoria sp. CS-180]|uniref:Nif11-like leader peptide family natural product precursor n=1 Tax=Oscillatoria sp. CS-180 TaxID=3021720 RepID=UPI00232F80F9|nr:Nif11-like leader peptide family natural product precursor [Oscillatoria sp. CS-180]MDB9524599.1 Nif11-like leader peptide family natural product precursor [Oscillatoria sp. CS-180]
MSATAVQEFLGKVSEDSALQNDLAKALEAENDRQAVADLAKSKGYDFSPEELAAEVERRKQEVVQRQEAGELSDEELEAVAGGELVASAVISAVIGSAGLTVASVQTTIDIFKPKW